jgi:hydroxyacylglutathione hydrolase
LKDLAPGITMLKRYGPYKNACWILQSGGEAAVVEMPLCSRTEVPPYQRVESFTRRRNLYLKYAFLSHGHIDHCQTLPAFRKWFPHTRFVSHVSMMEDNHFLHLMRRHHNIPVQDLQSGRYRMFDELYRNILWTGYIGREPVHLIWAPKHSYTDQLILFRGTMITGDWFLGDLQDCNAIVNPAHKVQAIDQAVWTVRNLNYHVSRMFSAHGDCLMHDVNFERIMHESKRSH